MFAIFGSGFGLYGYLPALVADGEAVILLERYRTQLNSRPELAGLAETVHWAHDETEALHWADGVVLARRPTDQDEWVTRCLAAPHVRRLILEKPIGSTPQGSQTLFRSLVASKKAFRIGYTFRFTPWAEHLLAGLPAQSRTLSLHWGFMAHHFQHDLANWKRFDSEGGGAVRFYGIQLIALLAELGYSEVIWSRTHGPNPGEIESWSAAFGGDGRPVFDVSIESRSAVQDFRISSRTEVVPNAIEFQAADPFVSGSGSGPLDRRVPYLAQLHRSFSQPHEPIYRWYERCNLLWAEIERKSEFNRVTA